MSLFSHYESCPKCRSNGRDNRGDNLAVYKDESVHCFSCGYHRSSNIFGQWSPTPSIRNRENLGAPKSLLPSDFSREIPAAAWKWLLQYGLPFSYWQESVGYSAKEERLIFRVGEPLAFSIGRYFGNITHTKWLTYGDSHKHCEIFGKGRGNSIVLVEDLISANKVGSINETIPLFGTRIHPCHLYYLINAGRPVILWLDKDQEGTLKRKAIHLESIINQPVSVITTDDDPKLLKFETIKELI